MLVWKSVSVIQQRYVTQAHHFLYNCSCSVFFFTLRDKFSVEKVPTLQEAVEECLKHQLTIFFDVKGDPEKVVLLKHLLS